MPPKNKKPVEEKSQPETKNVQKRELPPRPPVKPPVVPKKVEKVKKEPEGPVEKVPRKKPTIEGHIEKYDQILALLDAEIDRKSREKEKGARAFRKVRKIVIQMRKELPVVTRSKLARMQSSLRKNTTSGIMIPCQISKELAEFLQVPSDTKISRIEATRAICAYSHWKEDEKRPEVLRWKYLNPDGTRNLQNPLEKKAIIPDKALIKLLRYDQYRKNVKSGKVYKKVKDRETGKENLVQMNTDMLYYWVIQRLISEHFLKEEIEENQEEEEE